MDLDIKLFFKDPPRMKEDVKRHIRDVGASIVARCVHHLHRMKIDRATAKHVQFVFFHMAQEPLSRVVRTSLCVQQLRIKTMQKVFARVCRECEASEEKNAGIDKKIIRYVTTQLKAHGMKFSPQAALQLSACVAEICGILLNCTAGMMTEKTMTLSHFYDNSCMYCVSNGTPVLNNSLVRFLHYVNQPMPEWAPIDSKQQQPKPKERQVYKTQKLEMKHVSFADDRLATHS